MKALLPHPSELLCFEVRPDLDLASALSAESVLQADGDVPADKASWLAKSSVALGWPGRKRGGEPADRQADRQMDGWILLRQCFCPPRGGLSLQWIDQEWSTDRQTGAK
jgi:hypothetical protein